MSGQLYYVVGTACLLLGFVGVLITVSKRPNHSPIVPTIRQKSPEFDTKPARLEVRNQISNIRWWISN